MKRALFVVAHPDDAELMAGGTIAWLRARHIDVTVVVATVSEPRPELRPLRQRAAEEASHILDYRLEWIQGGELDQVEQLPEFKWVSIIDELIREYRPDLVFAHGTDDGHGDHVRLGRAVLATMRHGRGWYYELPPIDLRNGAIDRFVPNVFIDITPHQELKRSAIECYEYPGQSFRKLEVSAYEAQSRIFGARIGVQYAEAFALSRGIGFTPFTGESEVDRGSRE